MTVGSSPSLHGRKEIESDSLKIGGNGDMLFRKSSKHGSRHTSVALNDQNERKKKSKCKC